MIGIQAKIKNINKFYRDLKTYDDRINKARINAVKIEGYRLKLALQQEILAGAPGGKPFSPMRRISQLSRQYQAMYGSRLWDKTHIPKPGMTDPALRALAIPVRYEAKKAGDNFKVQVGYVKAKGVSDSWRRIAYKQQTGFTVPLTPLVRQAFATWPRKMAQAGHKPKGIYFPKEKTHLRVPGRDIISSFWRRQQNIAYHNIKRNFEAKVMGKYI